MSGFSSDPIPARHTETNDPLLIIALDPENVGQVLCVKPDGMLWWYGVGEVRVEWRWSEEGMDWVDLSSPPEPEDDEA